MTQPAPPQQSQAAQDVALATAAASVLLSAVVPDSAVQALAPRFALAGIPRPALSVAVVVVMGMPPEQSGMSGPATRRILMMNLLRRAQFVVSSARRVTADLSAARSRGESLAGALQQAMTRERRYYGQHLMAGWNRMKAAAQTDQAARDYGLTLGWYARLDKVTSAECRAADGKNFRADIMPAIGFPGMVHPNCRCVPGRAHAGAPMLASGRMLAA